MSQVVRPGEVTGPVPDIPFLQLPDRRTVFAGRAARLRRLAEGHALGDYLRFLAVVADAQQAELERFPQVPLPESDTRGRALGFPPVAATGWQRPAPWREGLKGLLGRIALEPLPAPARAVVQRLQTASRAELEALADQILQADGPELDPAVGPLVAAALQVCWTHLVTALGAERFARVEPPSLCPACGSRPVASVVRVGAAAQGLRYLVCSLCATQWHVVRAKCVVCDSAKDLSYYALEPVGGPGPGVADPQARGLVGEGTGPAGSRHASGHGPKRPAAPTDPRGRRTPGHPPAVQAEACDGCRTYLKIARMDRDPAVEPTADDLATLALDLRMAEAGYTRFGASPLLVPGSS